MKFVIICFFTHCSFVQVRFLWSDVGVSEEDLPRVLQTFPLVFALPLSRMKDVMAFLSEDLIISRNDIAKIIRCAGSDTWLSCTGCCWVVCA